jgi:hypothetical protein
MDEGFSVLPTAALAMTTDEPGGLQAWQWIKREARDKNIDAYAANPKYAIIPRR